MNLTKREMASGARLQVISAFAGLSRPRQRRVVSYAPDPEVADVSRAKHLRLFILASIVWVAFWAMGWPSYYQQYSRRTMLVFSLALLAGIIAFLPRVFRPLRPPRRVRVAFWMSFYFTVPLAAYDALYCGVYLGHGWAFAWQYWYLTAYYVIPWLVMPGAAATLNRSEANAEARRAASPVDAAAEVAMRRGAALAADRLCYAAQAPYDPGESVMTEPHGSSKPHSHE